MYIAHLPAGYLLGLACTRGRGAGDRALLVVAALLGAIAPDLDLLYFHVFTDGHHAHHHHAYWPHWPLVWVTLGLVGLVVRTRWRPGGGVLLLLAISALLHIGLDSWNSSVFWRGGMFWLDGLQAFDPAVLVEQGSTPMVALIPWIGVPTARFPPLSTFMGLEGWVWNMAFHRSSLLELPICLAATWVFFRRRGWSRPRTSIATAAPAALLASLVWAVMPVPPIEGQVVALRVDKSEHSLELLGEHGVLETYRIALGASPEGHKQRRGDERTPEGRYRIVARNPDSIAYRSLRISYPDADDRQRAAEDGSDPGGDIMIHGIRNGLGWVGRWHQLWDWTDGCIAVTDAQMSLLYDKVKVGTPIEVLP